MKFIVTHEISLERICDVLTAGLEDSQSDWHIIQKVLPSTWEFTYEPTRTDGKHYPQEYPLNPSGALYLAHDEEEDVDTLFTLDATTLQQGLTILSEKYPHHLTDILSENEDALTGDALLQCCLLGDIIYS